MDICFKLNYYFLDVSVFGNIIRLLTENNLVISSDLFSLFITPETSSLNFLLLKMFQTRFINSWSSTTTFKYIPSFVFSVSVIGEFVLSIRLPRKDDFGRSSDFHSLSTTS